MPWYKTNQFGCYKPDTMRCVRIYFNFQYNRIIFDISLFGIQ